MSLRPGNIDELRAIVREHPHILARGGGSKPALSVPQPGVESVDVSALSGIVEYEPAEYTVTALAGTPVAEARRVLQENGQYLPFDPPFSERGATLGGTLAAGVSGPGRQRYGGVRDFILGVQFVDGDGNAIRSGGKVVKNAAGFDLSKLMVGSLGRLGVLVELTFKVFPEPKAYGTVRSTYRSLAEALDALYRLAGSPIDMEALDLWTADDAFVLDLRVGGAGSALPERLERARTLVNGEVLAAWEDENWHAAREFAWAPEGWSLVKVPLTPARIPRLDGALAARGALRRYSAGGQVAWVVLPEPPAALHEVLLDQGLSGLAIFGPPGGARLGLNAGESFERRVKHALDAQGRFGEA